MTNDTALRKEYEYTSKKLEAHNQNNPEFNEQFGMMYEYYYSKFTNIINEADSQKFGEYLFQSIKSQFFNGYFIVREILLHDETILNDEFLTQPIGQLTEQIPELIIGSAGDNFDEAIISKEMHSLTVWAVTQYEDVRSLLRQIALDIVCLGAKRAILDEIELRGLERYNSVHSGLLSSIDDMEFINPQLYLNPMAVSSSYEIWQLSWWSSLQLYDNRAGEVILTTINTDNGTQYLLKVYLSNQISETEQKNILDTLTYRLMDRNAIGRDKIIITLATVNDFFILVQEMNK